ncbi:MAG: leucine-rich repeat domain-containing protein [Anaerolineae bacterium]|nr:leucine-rich repeat domain-containing protein [Anaerolineae bacterium]
MSPFIPLCFILILLSACTVTEMDAATVPATRPLAAQTTAPESAFAACAGVTQIPQIECEALVAIYTQMGGEQWYRHSGWLQTSTPCAWDGVLCVELHVRELSLERNRLVGDMPLEIGNLTDLKNLNLSYNHLSSLPPEIGNLLNLTYLGLSRNNLSSLPPEISNLSNLTELAFGDNNLSSLPPEIGNLVHLEWLELEDNNFSNLPPEIWNMPNLTYLSLSDNNLSSLPPEIGNLTDLIRLDLGDNDLSSLPPEIGNLTDLKNLNLSHNHLSSLPPEIGNLTDLIRLDLGGNYLSSLPPEIGNLVHLEWLELEDNNFSSLSPEIGNLVHLTLLLLKGNNLRSLPPEIGNLTNLTRVALEGNNLRSLPPQLCAVTIEDINLYPSCLPALRATLSPESASAFCADMTQIPPMECEMVVTAYEQNETKLLLDFFTKWESAISPINEDELEEQSDIVRATYEVYHAFYTPHNPGIQSVVLQNSIRAEIARGGRQMYEITIPDFRPRITRMNLGILYLRPDYEKFLLRFIESEFDRENEMGRVMFLERGSTIRIHRGHWGGWHLLTHPAVSSIEFNPELTEATVHFQIIDRGGEARFVKVDGQWEMIDSVMTWIE